MIFRRGPIKISCLNAISLLAIFVLLPIIAKASGAGITYHGRLVDKDGHAVESSNVQFKLQIRTPGNENCLMYEEVQVKDLSQASGAFAITLNDGTGTRLDSSGFSLDQIFANRNSYTFAGGICAAGNSFSPNPTDSRRIQVLFNDGTFPIGQWEPVPPMAINFVPMAIESMQVGGYKKEQLLKIADGVSTTGTELNSASWTELLALIAGTSTQFIKPNNANFTAAPTWSGTPATANDLVNKSYVDTQVAAGLPNVGTAGTYTKVTTDAKGRVTAGATLAEADLPNITTAGKVDGGAINAGTIGGATAINTSGNIYTTGTVTGLTVSATNLRVYNGSDYVQLSAPALGGVNVSFRLPSSDGSTGQVLKTDGAGNLSWLTPTTGSVTSVGATAPIASSGGTTPTISIAQSSGTTNGYLSSTDWTTFNNKLGTASALLGDVSGAYNTTSVDKIKGKDVVPVAYSSGQVLRYDGTNWVNASIGASDVPNLDAAKITTGTLPVTRGGTGATAVTDGQLVVGGALGTAYANLACLQTQTAAFNVLGQVVCESTNGTSQLVRLDASSKLPAVDGSLLTNINPANLSAAVAINKGGTGQVMQTAAFNALSPITTKGDLISKDATNNIRVAVGADGEVLSADSSQASGLKWIAASSGSVTAVTAGTGLNVGAGPNGTINTSGTLNIDVGTTTGKIVQVAASNKLPVIDGSNLTGLTAANISGTVAIGNGGTGQSTKAAGFDALSPTTTKGDVIVSNGTNNVRLAVGSNNQVLQADSAQASGVKWATITDTLAGLSCSTGDLPNWNGSAWACKGSSATNTNSTVILRDASGNFAANQVTLNTLKVDNGSAAQVTIVTPVAFTSWQLRLPATTGTANQVLQTDGSGNTTWATSTGLPAAAGTAAAPGYAFSGNTNTGIYNPAANQIGIANNGAETMRIDASGNIGVGIIAPAAKLEVAGDVKVGNSSATCSATTKGSIRYNNTSSVLEFCNGTGWNLIQAAACSDATPNVFSFTDEANATTTTLYTSNIVLIAGINCTVPVTVSGAGSPQYQICSDAACSSVVQGWTSSPASIVTGQYLQARLTTDTVGGSAFQATIIVGSGATVWTVTTTGSCASSPAIGTVCADGSVYAGLSPNGSVPMYATRCDAGQSWSGVACAGSRSAYSWNNGTGWTTTGYTGNTTGKANSAGIAALADAGSPHVTAQYCENLNENGQTDWYLPALSELNVLYQNKATIRNFNTSGSVYWSSTERGDAYSQYDAFHERFSDGVQSVSMKTVAALVRCVRR